MPAISATSSMVVGDDCPRVFKASMRPCRSSIIEYLVVGTSFRRSTSLAACTDQASTQGADANAAKASGVGATVLTVTFVEDS